MKSLNELILPTDLQRSETADESLAWAGAVTFLIVGKYVLFIKRSHTMPSHRGQLGFVGGHRQIDESPWETAKREFEEELSWSSKDLQLLGLHGAVRTANDSLIVPCICYLDTDIQFFIKNIKSNGEWDEAFLYPIEKLKQRSLWTLAIGHRGPTERNKILFHPVVSHSYIPSVSSAHNEYVLWGATARMVWNFFKF